MNLHTDGYESVVDDGAVTKIGFIAFAGFLDFVGERLQVTMASLQVGFGGFGVGKSGHDVPFKQVIAPETAHSKNGQLLELFEQGYQDGSEQSQKGQQDPKKSARKGCIDERPQSPQEGFTVFADLIVVTVVFCYHFCSWLS